MMNQKSCMFYVSKAPKDPVAQIVKTLEDNDALKYSIVVAATASGLHYNF